MTQDPVFKKKIKKMIHSWPKSQRRRRPTPLKSEMKMGTSQRTAQIKKIHSELLQTSTPTNKNLEDKDFWDTYSLPELDHNNVKHQKTSK